nr:MarR family winged helix-turn-helix transcriptional regulator [Stackebrandtia nassauensis]
MTTNSQPPVTSASIIVLTLARRIESELNAGLAPLDLTVSRLGLIGHINAVPGASFSDLARMSSTSVQTVHATVKTLVRSGLVRDRKARAGSASTIELTEQGTRLLAAAKDVIAEVDERLFGAEADPVQREIGRAVLDAFRDQRPD